MRKNKFFGISLASAFIALTAGQAQAADSTTAPMTVSLEISGGCSLGFNADGKSGDGLITFDTIFKLDKEQNKQTTLYVRCSGLDADQKGYKIMMNGGTSGDYKNRVLTSNDDAKHTIPYKLCRDSTCSALWGDKDPDIFARDWPQGETVDKVPIYAQLPVRLNEPLFKGDYSDTVTVTIDWAGKSN